MLTYSLSEDDLWHDDAAIIYSHNGKLNCTFQWQTEQAYFECQPERKYRVRRSSQAFIKT